MGLQARNRDFSERLVIPQSDWLINFVIVDKSLDNAAHVNVSRNCNSQSEITVHFAK